MHIIHITCCLFQITIFFPSSRLSSVGFVCLIDHECPSSSLRHHVACFQGRGLYSIPRTAIPAPRRPPKAGTATGTARPVLVAALLALLATEPTALLADAPLEAPALLKLAALLDKLEAAEPVAVPAAEVMLAPLLAMLAPTEDALEAMLLTAELAPERMEESLLASAVELDWAAANAPREATRRYLNCILMFGL
jgi:hypothetical protein